MQLKVKRMTTGKRKSIKKQNRKWKLSVETRKSLIQCSLCGQSKAGLLVGGRVATVVGDAHPRHTRLPNRFRNFFPSSSSLTFFAFDALLSVIFHNRIKIVKFLWKWKIFFNGLREERKKKVNDVWGR